MGGHSGEIRGKSKIEVYLKYEETIAGWEGIFEDSDPPKNKQLCKKLMVWDPDTGEWVLHYRLHT
jgi:hypothetical protein